MQEKIETLEIQNFILSKDDKFLLNVWGNVICIETLNTLINIIIK